MPIVFNPLTAKFDMVSDTSGFLLNTGDDMVGNYNLNGDLLLYSGTTNLGKIHSDYTSGLYIRPAAGKIAGFEYGGVVKMYYNQTGDINVIASTQNRLGTGYDSTSTIQNTIGATSGEGIYTTATKSNLSTNFTTEQANKSFIGLWGSVTNSGTAAITGSGNVTGIYSYASHNSASSLTGLYGINGQATVTGNGNVASLYGLLFQIGNTGSGTVTNSYSIYIPATTNSGGGAITNRYAIYQAGTSDMNYLGSNIGVLTAPNSAIAIGTLKSLNSATGSFLGVSSQVYRATTDQTDGGNNYGFYFRAQAGVGSNGYFAGMKGDAYASAPTGKNVSNVMGGWYYVAKTGACTVSQFYGQRIDMAIDPVAGNISNYAGLVISSTTSAGASGTISNMYGLQINALSTGGMTATNKYAIYQAGASDNNYFNGNTGIGTTPLATRKLFTAWTNPLNTTGTSYTGAFSSTIAQTAATGNSNSAGYFEVASAAGATYDYNLTGTVSALSGFAYNRQDTATTTYMRGMDFRVVGDTDGGVIDNAYGLYTSIYNNSGKTGTINNAYGIQVQQISKNSGTINYAYGIDVGAMTATNNTAIRTNNGLFIHNESGDSASDARFEGDTDANLLFTDASADRVGIGTNTPDTKLQVVGETRLGEDVTNYTNFDSTGHQTMAGTAKPWDDLRVEPVARTTGTGAPAFEKWLDDSAGTSRGCFVYSFTDESVLGNEKEVFFTMQMPHGWDGGPIRLHVHWMAESTAADSKVRWGLEYSFKEIGEVFGDTTLAYADTDYAGNTGTTALMHDLTEFTEITPGTTADGLSSILVGRLFRSSSNAADTYTGKAGLLYIDAHYQLSSIGSTDELSK